MLNITKQLGGSNSPLSYFNKLHKNETCLLLGNGPSLAELPLSFLQSFVTIGANTIFKGFTPTYYTTADTRVFQEFRKEVERIPAPKFLPYPKLGHWLHEEHFFWLHKEVDMPGDIEDGIDYDCIMHVQMQIADYMGFSTIYVNIDHTEDNREKFWGYDDHPSKGNIDRWAEGYKQIYEGIDAEMYNIAPNTNLSVIPRKDWHEV